MNVLIEKSFEKDIDRITSKTTKLAVAAIIEKATGAKSFSEIPNCKKMRSRKPAYRIRLGDYRIGIFYENKTAVFSRMLHRSKIYNYFP